MGENSAIEWTDHTFNPWVGCTKVSPACEGCYAEAWAKRSGMVVWGGARRRTTSSYWNNPRKWDAAAAAAGLRRRVFCASLADVFDKEVPQAWRTELFALIRDCTHLDWLLLTKRIGNAGKMLEASGVTRTWPHVWLGATIANQEELVRDLPKLTALPFRRFLSVEPMLGPLSFEGMWVEYEDPRIHENHLERIHLVICGGESGPKARPMSKWWVEQLRDQCLALEVPFFFKQWGEWAPGGPQGRDDDSMLKVGKKNAGRLLDGRTWDGTTS